MSHRVYLYNVQDPSGPNGSDVIMMEWSYEFPLLLQPLLVSGGKIGQGHYNEFDDKGSNIFYDARAGIDNLQRVYNLLGDYIDDLVTNPLQFLEAKDRLFDYLSKLKHPYFMVDMVDVFNMRDESHHEMAKEFMDWVAINNSHFTRFWEENDPEVLMTADWQDIYPGFNNFKDLLNHDGYGYGWNCIWNHETLTTDPTLFYENDLVGLKDADGNIILPAEYNEIYAFDARNRCVVVKDGVYGYLGRDGKWAIPLMYEDAYDFGYSNVAIVKLNGKMGLVNLENVPVTGFIYDDLKVMDDGMYYSAQLDGKWGMISETGETIVDFQLAEPVKEGYGFYYSPMPGKGRDMIFATSGELVGEYPHKAIEVVAGTYLHIKPYKNSTQHILYEGARKIAEGFDKVLYNSNFRKLLKLRKGKLYGAVLMPARELAIPIEYDDLIDRPIFMNSGEKDAVILRKGQEVGLMIVDTDDQMKTIVALGECEDIQMLRGEYFGFKKNGLWCAGTSLDNIVLDYDFKELFPKFTYPGIAYACENDEMYVVTEDGTLTTPLREEVELDLHYARTYNITNGMHLLALKQWLKKNP